MGSNFHGLYKEQQSHLSNILHINYLCCVKANSEQYSPRICKPWISGKKKPMDKSIMPGCQRPHPQLLRLLTLEVL